MNDEDSYPLFKPDAETILDYIIAPEKSQLQKEFAWYYSESVTIRAGDGRIEEYNGIKVLYEDLGNKEAVVQYWKSKSQQLQLLLEGLLSPKVIKEKPLPPQILSYQNLNFSSVVWGCFSSRVHRMNSLINKIQTS